MLNKNFELFIVKNIIILIITIILLVNIFAYQSPIFWGYNKGIVRYKELFLENDYNTSFELFSIHIWKGHVRGKLIFLTILNFTWTISKH